MIIFFISRNRQVVFIILTCVSIDSIIFSHQTKLISIIVLYLRNDGILWKENDSMKIKMLPRFAYEFPFQLEMKKVSHQHTSLYLLLSSWMQLWIQSTREKIRWNHDLSLIIRSRLPCKSASSIPTCLSILPTDKYTNYTSILVHMHEQTIIIILYFWSSLHIFFQRTTWMLRKFDEAL